FGSIAIHGSTCVSASEPPAPAKGSALICSTNVFFLNASDVCAFTRPARATARRAAAVRKVDTAGDRMRAHIPRQAAQRSEQVRLRPTRKGLTVVAAWPRNTCGPTRVRLRATIDARCEVIRGVLRAARAVPVTFAAPRCGDASIDSADGEECDAGGCDANEEC